MPIRASINTNHVVKSPRRVLSVLADLRVERQLVDTNLAAAAVELGNPIGSFDRHYTNAPAVRHIGPMSQDFQAAFNVGEDDKHISVVDGLGVAFAAIQGLHAQVQEKDTEIALLQRQVAAMTKELASVKEDITDRLALVERAVSRNITRASFQPKTSR